MYRRRRVATWADPAENCADIESAAAAGIPRSVGLTDLDPRPSLESDDA